MSRAVFVDRDGVINQLVPDPVSGRRESPLLVGDVELIDGAAGALRCLAAAGWRLVGVSNQPAAAKGRLTIDAVYAVQARVLELLAANGAIFDDFRLCLHHPEGVVPELRGECDCRKPAPGMLFAAARTLGVELSASWMVGDTSSDIRAGLGAGCRTILVEHPGSAHKRIEAVMPTATASDLAAAATVILAAEGVTSPS